MLVRFTFFSYSRGFPLINELPNELVMTILSFLDPSGMYAAVRVCKVWKEMISDESRWREMYTRR